MVANKEADIPPLPKNFGIARVDLPPNSFHEKDKFSADKVRAAVRYDKGNRILAGILEAHSSRFIMPVDDDDLLSIYLSEFVEAHANREGWYVEDGFEFMASKGVIWSTPIRNFWRTCGTCNIFRPSRLPFTRSVGVEHDEVVSELLGGHVGLKPFLENNDCPLQSLDFKGAAYRVGHSNSHSNAALSRKSMFRRHVVNRQILRTPLHNLRKIHKLQRNSKTFRLEFVGE